MKGRKKGTAKSGGRTKGTPNKTTQEIKECIIHLLDKNIELLQNDIEKLEPKDRIQVIDKLLKFVLPQNIDITNTIQPQQELIIVGKKFAKQKEPINENCS